MANALRRARGGLALFVLLLLWAPCQGQGERPWPRLFGPRTPEKAPAKAPQPEMRRLIEIQVEIAWLADPVTFPYYLEARATANSLEVRGYVPNQAVRDHALNLARVYAALPIVDAVKEHPSLLVKPGQMSPQQLHNAVASALREALPRQAPQLQARCDPDGKVVVTGSVQTSEERLLVSHALRRLYGCTSVQNLTRLTTETGPPPLANKSDPAPPSAKVPPVRTAEPAPAKVQGPVLPTAGPEPEKQGPPAAASPALAARLKKQIEAACPGVKEVKVEVAATSEFRIEVTVRSEEQVSTFAERILELPDVQSNKADMQFKVVP
jgi:hypothetical protein